MRADRADATKKAINAAEDAFVNNGVAGRVARFERILVQLINISGGGIIEIGAGYGESTMIFIGAADSVLVVDPWTNPTYTFEAFCRNVGDSPKIKIVHDVSSSAEARRSIELFGSIGFAFVDGLQDCADNVLYDIILCAGAEVICVDDYSTRSQVKAAINTFLSSSAGDKYQLANIRSETLEAYLIKLDTLGVSGE